MLCVFRCSQMGPFSEEQWTKLMQMVLEWVLPKQFFTYNDVLETLRNSWFHKPGQKCCSLLGRTCKASFCFHLMWLLLDSLHNITRRSKWMDVQVLQQEYKLAIWFDFFFFFFLPLVFWGLIGLYIYIYTQIYIYKCLYSSWEPEIHNRY